MPLRLRTQVSRPAACAPADSTAAPAIITGASSRIVSRSSAEPERRRPKPKVGCSIHPGTTKFRCQMPEGEAVCHLISVLCDLARGGNRAGARGRLEHGADALSSGDRDLTSPPSDNGRRMTDNGSEPSASVLRRPSSERKANRPGRRRRLESARQRKLWESCSQPSASQMTDDIGQTKGLFFPFSVFGPPSSDRRVNPAGAGRPFEAGWRLAAWGSRPQLSTNQMSDVRGLKVRV